MRKPNIVRRIMWRNPLLDFAPLPYLAAPIFPKDEGTPQYDEAMKLLLRSYTPQRLNGEVDARRFRDFIRDPDKHVFVIWGDIGIGKSSFVRYELHALRQEHPGSFYHGVVDMLRASTQTAQHQLEEQIIGILEAYFRDNLGGVNKGLRPYANFRAKKNYGNIESDEGRAESNRIVQEVLESRGTNRADLLLSAIEHTSGPALFIVVDNVDRAVGEDQHTILDLVVRSLHNTRIYLIIALRASSRIILDDSKIFGFFEKDEMSLSAVDFSAMLRVRFSMSRKGEDLRHVEISDGKGSLTFPALLEMLLGSESGQLLLDLAGTNARKLLDFVSRVLYSNQLGGLSQIAQPEACIAALLMLDEPHFDPELSYILNLFDNNESDLPGNALIRFRVLEVLNQLNEVSFGETRPVSNYFESLGYSAERVRDVIATFVGAGLAQTDPPRTADNIRSIQLSDIGTIIPVRSNISQYFNKLLKSPWYFVSVKADIYLPEHLIRKDCEEREYVADADFVEFLKNEEEKEQGRIQAWSRRYGRLNFHIKSFQPWAMARVALDHRRLARPLGDIKRLSS